MKETINTLKGEAINIDNMRLLYNGVGLEHGSADQTRFMLFQSIFEQAIGNIQIAIKQLEILDKELY